VPWGAHSHTNTLTACCLHHACESIMEHAPKQIRLQHAACDTLLHKRGTPLLWHGTPLSYLLNHPLSDSVANYGSKHQRHVVHADCDVQVHLVSCEHHLLASLSVSNFNMKTSFILQTFRQNQIWPTAKTNHCSSNLVCYQIHWCCRKTLRYWFHNVARCILTSNDSVSLPEARLVYTQPMHKMKNLKQ